jgi:hypothetical protein
MLNTTYKELLNLCVSEQITNLTALSRFLEYPYKELYSTVEALSTNGCNLFNNVKQELFKKNDWFDDDYEFDPTERLDSLDYIQEDLYITDFGSLLQKKTITIHGKTFCKFVECKTYCKGSADKDQRLCFQRIVNGVKTRFMIDILVAKHFIDNPEGYTRVKHIRDNPFDNHYTQIQWF